MSLDVENARKLVELDDRAKAAVAELGKVSLALRNVGKDLKLSGWDWSKSSSTVSIMPQGRVHMAIVDIKDRPV